MKTIYVNPHNSSEQYDSVEESTAGREEGSDFQLVKVILCECITYKVWDGAAWPIAASQPVEALPA